MAADMAVFLWNKTLNDMKEAESSSGFSFASHFRKIIKAMESQNKENICSSNAEGICELLYDLNDELAEYRIFVQRKALKRSRIPFKHSMQFLSERKRKKQLVNIEKRFEEIRKGEGQSSTLRNLQLRFDASNESGVLGFDETIKKIESLFFRRIIGIYGKVGTGKTTLARSVFDSEIVRNQFPKKIWFCLSDIKRNEKDIGAKILDLVLKELDGDPALSKIHEFVLKELDGDPPLSKPLDILQAGLSLSDDRYLLVFDDVWPWHANFLADETLAGRLGSNGAVIITSRLKGVVRRMSCEKLVHLQPQLLKIEDRGKICEHGLASGISDGSGILRSIICDGGYQIIVICGIGGAGKTTLSRKVFNSEKVRNLFSKRIWVCLSHIQKNEKDIGAKISKLVLDELEYDISEPTMDSPRDFLDTLEHLLSDERFLIVFDDVWPWHADFLAAEIYSERGSRGGIGGAVIVLSRLPEVASRFAGENLIQLEPSLLEKNCLHIFKDTLKSGLQDETKIGSQQGFVRIEKILSEDGFKIIGICGMVGAGKTTLARKVLSEGEVSKAFSRKIWISLKGISENEQNIRAKIVKLALEELGYDFDECIEDDFSIELFGILEHLFVDERYLIVFDDVRPSHAQFLSEQIDSARRSPGGGGCAVIVISRLQGLAESFRGMNLISLQHHNKDDYENIVKQSLTYDQATWDRIKNETHYKCSGLPLAAKTLGEIFLEKIKKSENFS